MSRVAGRDGRKGRTRESRGSGRPTTSVWTKSGQGTERDGSNSGGVEEEQRRGTKVYLEVVVETTLPEDGTKRPSPTVWTTSRWNTVTSH